MNDFFHSLFQNPSTYPGARSLPRRVDIGGGAAVGEGVAMFGQETNYTNDEPLSCNATPAASERAIRQIPTVAVTQEDLIDENNRSCCICFDE